MKNIICIFILIGLLNSCQINKFRIVNKASLKGAVEVKFCELLRYDNSQLIKTRAIYSGIEEYWELHSHKECGINHQVEFNIDENYEDWQNILLVKKLKQLYSNYSKYEMELEIIGYFEIDSLNGFGHLGTNKYQITPVSIKIIDKIKKVNEARSD